MDPQLFRNITVCDAEAVWTLVRDIVGVQLFGENVITVPHLKEALSYDLTSVILKEGLTTVEKLKRETPGALAVGTLANILKPGTDNGVAAHVHERASSSENINQHYIFEESDIKHNVKKSVRVELEDGEHWHLVNEPESLGIAVNLEAKGFSNVKKFYLVNDVFYAKSVRLTVAINDKLDQLIIKERIPIGIKLKRYKIQDGGKIGSVKDITKDDWRVVWIKQTKFRNPMSNLPPVPANNGEER